MIGRFYGWTDDYIDSLSINTFNQYLLAIEVLNANERLTRIEDVGFTHFKDNSVRTKILKSLKSKIKNGLKRKVRIVSIDDIAKSLARTM